MACFPRVVFTGDTVGNELPERKFEELEGLDPRQPNAGSSQWLVSCSWCIMRCVGQQDSLEVSSWLWVWGCVRMGDSALVKRVLIIYTGGTIGMKRTESGYAPEEGWLEAQLQSIYAFQDPDQPPRTTPRSQSGARIGYDIVAYEPLLDSANMEIRHWVQIAQDIEHAYHQYDGFVVLHGTDTMAYTASALSFMLVNLRKTVVLTGSQIPLSEVRNDAVSNLLGALTLAGLYEIPEVCLYFDHHLFRGNRVSKVDASGLGAFQSGNLPPLATVGIQIDVAWHLLQAAPARPLRLRTIEEQNVVALRLFPGMRTELLARFLQPPVRGVVLETYGTGNIPSTRSDFLQVLREATDRGVIIVNCTQCARGSVTGAYVAGTVLAKAGVVSGHDMTPEAALTKLAYLLSQSELTPQQVKHYITQDLRGELTPQHHQDRFSFQEQAFADTVSKVLTQGEQHGISHEVSQALFPVLMCAAATRGDIEAVERMLRSNISIDASDYDGRTALHLASAEGQREMVRFLLESGADTGVLDRWGSTPLSDALRHQHTGVAELLRDHGAKLDPAGREQQLCNAAAVGDLASLQALIRDGLSPCSMGEDSRTPLHLAAAGGHSAVVRYLLDAGASPLATDRWGQTPLELARRSGEPMVIAILEGQTERDRA